MKTLCNTFGILALVLSFIGCKENTKLTEVQNSPELSSIIQNEEIVSNYTPASDKLFSRAIRDFEDNYMEGAVTVLNEAILAIKYEGAGLEGTRKNAFENAIIGLKAINNKIKNGKHVTRHQLLQAIANVRHPLYHPIFHNDAVYIVAKSHEENQLKLNRAFDESAEFFKTENIKFDDAIEKEMELLKKESEQIEKLKAELQTKMKDHLKKTQEFNKKNNPEYYDDSYFNYIEKK